MQRMSYEDFEKKANEINSRRDEISSALKSKSLALLTSTGELAELIEKAEALLKQNKIIPPDRNEVFEINLSRLMTSKLRFSDYQKDLARRRDLA